MDRRTTMMSATAAVMACTLSAWAGDKTLPDHQSVVVCMDRGEPFMSWARIKATRIFKDAGVDIVWRCATPQTEAPVQVRLSMPTSGKEHPGALAYASPFQGSRIVVYRDRVYQMAAADPYRAAKLMAYVLVHEITHILRGTDVHSREGIMKDRWNSADQEQIYAGKLAFTQADIELIQLGLESRELQKPALLVRR